MTRKVTPRVVYRIAYSPAAEEHLRILTARQRGTIFDNVDKQLAHQPRAETRNRKPMRPNPLAPWELRIGKLRESGVQVGMGYAGAKTIPEFQKKAQFIRITHASIAEGKPHSLAAIAE